MITISLIILELFLSVGIFGIDIVINITNIAIIIESKASSFINFIMSILTLGFAHCSLLPPNWPPQWSLWTENSFITSNCRRMLMMMMVMMRVVAMMVIMLLMMMVIMIIINANLIHEYPEHRGCSLSETFFFVTQNYCNARPLPYNLYFISYFIKVKFSSYFPYVSIKFRFLI